MIETNSKFAVYATLPVIVLGIEGNEALIQFDDGDERYVDVEQLDFTL